MFKKNLHLHHLVTYSLLALLLISCGGGGGSSTNTNNDDTTKPIITIIGDSTINITVGDSFSDPGATANDDVDGNISNNIIIAGDTVNTNSIGTYIITYNVSDTAGNTASQVIRTVTVTNATVSNNINNFIAYKVEDSVSNIDSVFVVRGNGSDHRNLHLSIPSGGEIISYDWGPSANSRIAYLGDVDTDTVNELYTFDPSINSRDKLNSTLPSGGNVIEYKWSPDGSKIAYRANQDDFNKIELYVIDVNGQNRIKVNTALVTDGNVEEFSWSPASSHLLYRADNSVNEHFNWHIATKNGATSNQVNVNYSTGESITAINWSPKGNYIDYIHDLAGNADVDLYIYKVSDLSNSKIATFSFANTQKYKWSDSELHFTVGVQNGGINIHPLSGGSITNIPNISNFEFIPNTENLITFRTNVLSSVSREFLTAVYDPSGNTINSETSYLTGNYYGEPRSFNFSPDAEKVIIDFDANVGISDTLFVYNLSTNSSINLNTTANTTPTLNEVSWSTDSTRLLIINGVAGKLIISPDGSGLVNLVNSTSVSATSLLYHEQWNINAIYLVRGTGISATSDEILTLNSLGQNLNVISNSDTTHAFYCSDSFCNNQTPSFKISNDNSFMVYRRVGDPSVSASDDIHALNIDGTGDVTISDNLTSPLQQRITEFSIQPVN